MTTADRDRLLARIRELKAAEEQNRRNKIIGKGLWSLIGFFLYPAFLMVFLRFLHTQWVAVPAWGYWRCMWILILAQLAIWGAAKAWRGGMGA